MEFRRARGYSFPLHYCNKCCICGKEHPEFASLMMQNGRMVNEEFPDVQVDKDRFVRYVICQGCEDELEGRRKKRVWRPRCFVYDDETHQYIDSEGWKA